MSQDLHMPPPDCPNNGICVNLTPRVDAHDKALESMGKNIGNLQRDVHEITIVLRERDKLYGFLKAVFLSLLGIGLVGLAGICGQVILSARWMAKTDASIEAIVRAATALERVVTDHEARLRAEEKEP